MSNVWWIVLSVIYGIGFGIAFAIYLLDGILTHDSTMLILHVILWPLALLRNMASDSYRWICEEKN